MLTPEEKDFDSKLVCSIINLLLDRLIFNTLSFYRNFPAFNTYVLQSLQQEETMGLADRFEDVLQRPALLDTIRIVRPDFLGVLLYFILRTDVTLQKNCLLLLKALLESKNQQLNLISITSQSKGLVDLLLDVLHLD